MPKIVEITWDQFEALRELGAPVGFSYGSCASSEPAVVDEDAWKYLQVGVSTARYTNRRHYFARIDSDE